MSELAKVELKQVYEWGCPYCGQRNYNEGCDAVECGELTLEDAKEMGMVEQWHTELPEEFKQAGWTMVPDVVQCVACGRKCSASYGENDNAS